MKDRILKSLTSPESATSLAKINEANQSAIAVLQGRVNKILSDIKMKRQAMVKLCIAVIVQDIKLRAQRLDQNSHTLGSLRKTFLLCRKVSDQATIDYRTATDPVVKLLFFKIGTFAKKCHQKFMRKIEEIIDRLEREENQPVPEAEAGPERPEARRHQLVT